MRGLPGSSSRSSTAASSRSGRYRQYGLDFRQFDAEAAQLDLSVGAAEILQITVFPISGPVARLVKPITWLSKTTAARKGVGQK